ncbi:MAG: GYF domain-containing protein [Polyangiales bacterium]
MKFLCRNCKAKYQIADEKVAGRTLRMTCQQCGEPIVVRGPARQATGGRPMVTAGTGATAPNAAIAATGANTLLAGDLAHHLVAPPREAGASHEEWHVAINDAPVGPLRRDEVARMVGQGAIDRESLAWREGMDDWLPVRHIAELASLFTPSVVPSHSGTGSISLAPGAPAPASAVGIRATGATAARVEHAPIGGRQVVPVEDYAPTEDSEPPAEVAVATVQPVLTAPVTAPVAPPPPPSSRQLGWAQMFALVSGGAFILAAGALLGVRVLAPSNPAPAPAASAPAAPPPPATAEAARPAKPAATDDEPEHVIELDMQAIDGASSAAARKPVTPSPRPNSPAQASAAGDKKQLTAEQREMLERMGGGLNQGGPSNIRAPSESGHNNGAHGTGQLTAEQLSSVVLNGRKNLQRCYETALRGANSTETVRLDIEIQVSPSGNVTSVRTSGKGLTGMDDCITRTVKMWRFPMSAEVTQTHFPVVFQPGT